MKADLGNGLTLKIVENQYTDGHYRVSLLRVETLDSVRFGVGGGGSAKEGVLSEEGAMEAFEILKSEIDPTAFEFTDDGRIQQLRDSISDPGN